MLVLMFNGGFFVAVGGVFLVGEFPRLSLVSTKSVSVLEHIQSLTAKFLDLTVKTHPKLLLHLVAI